MSSLNNISKNKWCKKTPFPYNPVQFANKLTQKVRNYSQIIEMNAMREYSGQ